MITRKDIETFLFNKRGYIKKSAAQVAKALKQDESEEVLRLVQEVLSDVREFSRPKEDKVDEPLRILYFDIEVSPNLVFSWGIGNKVNLGIETIVQERAIICVCWKWADEKEVHSLEWNKGDDRKLCIEFAKVINSADVVIGQNSDAFDIKWFRTRCLFHDIPLRPKFQSIDTLKLAKAGFKFNSNKLDYMGKFLVGAGKTSTGFDLWKDIVLHNNKEAMSKMVNYCKNDVLVLEAVYRELSSYSPVKKFKKLD